MGIVGGEDLWDGLDENFVKLLERRFYWRNPIDRALEGHVDVLRKEAMDRGVKPEAIVVGEPSVLEVLVYLAIEVEMRIMYEPDDDPSLRIPGFFTDLVTTLGFDCDICDLDLALDKFLDGSNWIGSDPESKGLPLWTQVQRFVMDQFRIEVENII